MKIAIVAGTRPNFMKVAPILAELHKVPDAFTPFFVCTGQHYDYQLSAIFFEALDLPAPDAYLDVVRDNESQQMADIIAKFDRVLETEKPDLVVVVGDVTSTSACALAASKRCSRSTIAAVRPHRSTMYNVSYIRTYIHTYIHT